MNYYEHHIGDYAEATLHLSFVEDAAYSRLIRKYYAQERPLPADLKTVQRLVGARTKEEKEAVKTVLEEFFSLEADGWHQERCDQEIEQFRAGEPERAAKKSNEDTRTKRHREERARLFSLLNQAGQHAPWNIAMAELRSLVKQHCGEAATPVTAPVTPPVTAPATPVTATQTPDTNTHTQTPEEREGGGLPATTSPAPARNAQIAVLLRSMGIQTTPSHPLVCMTWANNPKVTDYLLTQAAATAKQRKPNQRLGAEYLEPIVNDLLKAGGEAAGKEPWEVY